MKNVFFTWVALSFICTGIMAAPQHVIITGAPTSGKTATLLQLEKLGFDILPEAARDSIQLELAKGVSKPYEKPELEISISDLYKMRSNKFVSQPSHSIVFWDRSPLDTLAFVRFYKKNMPASYFEELSKWAKSQGVSKNVFLMAYAGKEEIDQIRTTNREDCIKLEQLLVDVYKEYGFNIHIISFKPVDTRAQEVLNQLNLNQPNTDSVSFSSTTVNKVEK